MLHVHLNHNQLQPLPNSYGRRKLCAVCLAQTLPIFTRLHRTNLCRMQAAKEMPQTNTHSHTHTPTRGTPHTIYLPQVASYVPNKRSWHGSGSARTPHRTVPLFTESKKVSKSSDLIRQPTAEKKDYTFLVGVRFAGCQMNLAGSVKCK